MLAPKKRRDVLGMIRLLPVGTWKAAAGTALRPLGEPDDASFARQSLYEAPFGGTMSRRARSMSECPSLRLSALKRKGREQAEAARALDSLSATMRAKLRVEVADMRIDGVHRPGELVGDLRL